MPRVKLTPLPSLPASLCTETVVVYLKESWVHSDRVLDSHIPAPGEYPNPMSETPTQVSGLKRFLGTGLSLGLTNESRWLGTWQTWKLITLRSFKAKLPPSIRGFLQPETVKVAKFWPVKDRWVKKFLVSVTVTYLRNKLPFVPFFPFGHKKPWSWAKSLAPCWGLVYDQAVLTLDNRAKT